jgi:hypothetical protein
MANALAEQILVKTRPEIIPVPELLILDPIPESAQELIDLADEASTLLGYKPLKKATDPILWKRKQAQYENEQALKLALSKNEFAAVLQELQIEVLDENSVAQYEQCMLNKLNPKPKEPKRRSILLEILFPEPDRVPSEPRFKWERKVLDESYSNEIPPFALRKATAIKKQLPHAEFFIEELIDVPQRKIEDPFLIVRYGVYLGDGELNWANYFGKNMSQSGSTRLSPAFERYIEVWDEPKFELGL